MDKRDLLGAERCGTAPAVVVASMSGGGRGRYKPLSPKHGRIHEGQRHRAFTVGEDNHPFAPSADPHSPVGPPNLPAT